MELKGCVSHYEGLRTYVEWLFGDIVNNLKFSDFKKNLKICTRPGNDPRPQIIPIIDLNTTRNDPPIFSHATRNDPRGIIGMERADVSFPKMLELLE